VQPGYALVRRLSKINTTQSFSVREQKSLRALIRSQKKTNTIDLPAIAKEFPGKNIKTLERIAKKLLKIRVWPKHFKIIR